MTLSNVSSLWIQCRVNGGETVHVPPKSSLEVPYPGTPTVTLSLCHGYGCAESRDFNTVVCNIVVDSTCTFHQVAPDSTFVLRREWVHFTYGYCYDRFFVLSRDALFAYENHTVAAPEEILAVKKAEDKEYDRWEWGLETLWNYVTRVAPGSVLLFAIIKVACWVEDTPFSFWYLPLFLVVGFLGTLLFVWIFQKLDKPLYRAIGKLFRMSPETNWYHEQELKGYVTNDYIKKYYADPNRSWVDDDIRRE
ncbi:MAG: hypothetical protein IJZ13_00525 [Clostridia bacterium]|nr:hypothetical protein [Clostridia bacterium]